MILVFILITSIQFLHVVGKCPRGCECPTVDSANCVNSFFTDIPQGLNNALLNLNLDYNKIPVLKNNVFTNNNVLTLQSLNLANNVITEIDSSVFCATNSLENIDLSGNKLTSIHRDTFLCAVNLKWLNLAHNEMLVLPHQGHFLNAHNIEVLYLSNSNIGRIQAGTFQCMPNLERLYLDNNKLNNLDVTVFTNMDMHATCNKSSTSLTRLRTLDLSENPWVCDCVFYDLTLWYIGKRLGNVPGCSHSDNTWGRLEELKCNTSTISLMGSKTYIHRPTTVSLEASKSSGTHSNNMNINDAKSDSYYTDKDYKSVFITGIVIGVLSASCVFLIFATIVYLLRKCWNYIYARRGRREGYENIDEDI